MLVTPETNPGGWSIRATLPDEAAPTHLFTWVLGAASGINRAVADAARHGFRATGYHAVPMVYAYSGDGGRTWHVDKASARADAVNATVAADHLDREYAAAVCYSGAWVETGGPAVYAEASHV